MRISMKLIFMPLLLSLIFMNDSKVFAAHNKITLGSTRTQDSPAGKALNLIYTEAFKRLGMVFVFKTYPAKRSSYMSDSGKLDGELSRIYSYNEVHTNMIRVEEPHWTSEFVAIAIDPTIQLDGWNSLKGKDYTVNYRRGIKGTEINLPKVVSPERLVKVNGVYGGLKRVLSGRADIFVETKVNVVNVLQSDEFKCSGLRIVGVMEKFTGHAFLHKKHRELVPKLSDVLVDMKKEGLFEEYRNISKIDADKN